MDRRDNGLVSMIPLKEFKKHYHKLFQNIRKKTARGNGMNNRIETSFTDNFGLGESVTNSLSKLYSKKAKLQT